MHTCKILRETEGKKSFQPTWNWKSSWEGRRIKPFHNLTLRLLHLISPLYIDLVIHLFGYQCLLMIQQIFSNTFTVDQTEVSIRDGKGKVIGIHSRFPCPSRNPFGDHITVSHLVEGQTGKGTDLTSWRWEQVRAKTSVFCFTLMMLMGHSAVVFARTWCFKSYFSTNLVCLVEIENHCREPVEPFHPP